jgi:hypothetical protein
VRPSSSMSRSRLPGIALRFFSKSTVRMPAQDCYALSGPSTAAGGSRMAEIEAKAEMLIRCSRSAAFNAFASKNTSCEFWLESASSDLGRHGSGQGLVDRGQKSRCLDRTSCTPDRVAARRGAPRVAGTRSGSTMLAIAINLPPISLQSEWCSDAHSVSASNP